MPAIQSVEARLFAVPLAEVLYDAKHGDHTHFELITATIRLDDGTEGTGYTYTGGRVGQAIRRLTNADAVTTTTSDEGSKERGGSVSTAGVRVVGSI